MAHLRDGQRIGAARVLARALADTVERGHVAQSDLVDEIVDLSATMSVLEEPTELAWIAGFILNRLAGSLFDPMPDDAVEDLVAAFDAVDGVRALLCTHRLDGPAAGDAVMDTVSTVPRNERAMVFATALLVLSEAVNDSLGDDPAHRRRAVEGLIDAILGQFAGPATGPSG